MSEARDIQQEAWMREISEKMGKVLSLTESQTVDLIEIKTQTIKTNGRVGRLENWRSYCVGAIGILVFVITIYAKLH